MNGRLVNSLLTERARLLIMATLAASESPIEFVSLVEATKLSKGNLSAHIKKLEEAQFVLVEKKFIQRKPVTRYRCTDLGRSEVKGYLEEVETMLKSL